MAYLLEPLVAGPLTLKNRLVMPPMATAKSNGGLVSPALLEYYHEKSADGAFSIVIMEHCYVRLEGRARTAQISAADDWDEDGLRKLSDIVHQNGSKVAMQINHAGSAAKREVIGQEPVAPSAVRHPKNEDDPRELTKREIADIVTAFAKAAGRAKKAGFDAVEIHAAHFYLLNQFYSPLSNKRTDAYGGTLLNRIRVHLEVIEAVKGEVGNDFPLLLRLGACDYTEGGITLEDSVKASREFEKAGVHILDVSGSVQLFFPPSGVTGQGYFAPLTSEIKKTISIPVILTGGITEAEAAENLLREKKADLIGVGRAVLADSGWGIKAHQSLR